jgi:hypothetical protein
MDDMSANPAAGSDSDPVSMIEGILEREQAPTERPRDQKPEPEPEVEEIPDPEPGPEVPPTEEEGGEEEDGDATEEPEQQEPVSELFTVKIDGREQQVTKEELLAGYQREADYRRKTQEIAANRQAVEAEIQRIAAERAHYAQELATVETVLRQTLPPRPTQQDYDADPIGAVQAERRWQDAAGQLQHVMAERNAAAKAWENQQQQMQQQMMQQARERLTEYVPEWSKPEIAAKEKPKVAEHLRSIGYTDAEIGQAADPRALVMARESMLYRQLMASKPQVQQRVANAPKMVKPGAAGPAPDRSKAIVQKIKRSGGKDIDAVAALLLT